MSYSQKVCNHCRSVAIPMVVLVAFLSFYKNSIAQKSQIDINRVALMPNIPSPFSMRDWKKVAYKYDSFIFNLNSSGQYLPLMNLKPSGINYPALQPILLDSYVGINGAGSEAEGINILAALVGASLLGVDKTTQFGKNWVLKAKDFYNKANGQNIYLNGYAAASGNDWWYDLMPNVFFYQLYSHYPNTIDFDKQFISVADRWLSAVNALGGSSTPWTIPQMNYRAFNFSTMLPNSSGVSEPESAGTIGWLLYHAYLQTKDKKYLAGAQQTISYLSSLNFNPAYEIQLPYGTFIAAKMNAELGTHYDVQKMLNWSFDQSSKRNWGTIVGTWGDAVTGSKDVSGLVGEIDNPSTGYAFAMNGFQQAAALVPLVKYDKRFAKTIAKWILNLANASRFFYASHLPSSHQDSYNWSAVNDINSVIGYEGLKQTNGSLNLFATGDAIRTGSGATNLGVYGSSHVGYLAAIVQPTDVSGILLLDVNKTDFFGQNPFPSFLVYNPLSTDQAITLPLETNTYDIYDALSETIIKTNASGNYLLTIPTNQAMLLSYLPQGAAPVSVSGKLMLGIKIVDHSYGYNFNAQLRIQSLATKDSVVQFNQSVPIYNSIENASGAVTYNWFLNGALVSSSTSFTWVAPTIAGKYKLLLNVSDGVASAKDSLSFRVVDYIPVPPAIAGFTTDKKFYYADSAATITCHPVASNKSQLQYTWSISSGTIISQSDSVLRWKASSSEGLVSISCTLKNLDQLEATAQHLMLVKKTTQFINEPVAYFPLDGNTKDYSGNGHDATLNGVQPTANSLGEPNKAYKFSNSSDIIDVPNATSLNFQNQITLSFWLKLDVLPTESYVLSHGSYQQRWKVSVLPTGKIRWTVNTTTSIKDLDSSFPLQLNQFYHFTVLYTGYSIELYNNGMLDNFIAGAGLISIATDDITFGRQTATIKNYSLFGTLDEVRVYDKALGPNEIIKLKTLWNTNSITSITDLNTELAIYPNPTSGNLYVKTSLVVKGIELINLFGRKVSMIVSNSVEGVELTFEQENRGLFLLKIETDHGVVYRKIVVN